MWEKNSSCCVGLASYKHIIIIIRLNTKQFAHSPQHTHSFSARIFPWAIRNEEKRCFVISRRKRIFTGFAFALFRLFLSSRSLQMDNRMISRWKFTLSRPNGNHEIATARRRREINKLKVCHYGNLSSVTFIFPCFHTLKKIFSTFQGYSRLFVASIYF